VQAQLSSRQAAQAKWKRLVDPGRRIATGDMRRGGRRAGHQSDTTSDNPSADTSDTDP